MTAGVILYEPRTIVGLTPVGSLPLGLLSFSCVREPTPVNYTVSDGTSGEPFSRTTLPFTVPDFSGSMPAIGTPIFLRDRSEDLLTAAAIDGNTFYGRAIQAYVPLVSNSPPTNLRYEILSVGGNTESKETVEFRTIEAGTGEILGSVMPGAFVPDGNNLAFRLKEDSVRSGVYGAALHYSAYSLEEGEYAPVAGIQCRWGASI